MNLYEDFDLAQGSSHVHVAIIVIIIPMGRIRVSNWFSLALTRPLRPHTQRYTVNGSDDLVDGADITNSRR